VIKDPFVLEFLDLQERAHFQERDLEQAIIDRLEAFLLEWEEVSVSSEERSG
jgi:predicted nuclease of restriction endonuclease-like (RecB) superfamily